jgi:NodT family efflux transporter outer membrane factor (OMF) lipoprotein
MFRMHRLTRLYGTRCAAFATAALLAVCLSGCTSFNDYIHNGFKVGPNYCKPPAPVSKHWIDAVDLHAVEASGIQCRWWTVFHDPKLDELIACAYRQNLTLREAGFRILQARATLNATVGNLFPQSQTFDGRYARSAVPTGPNTPTAYTSSWNYGFNLNWQLDFWGRFRRAIARDEANLDVSVADYDAALVTLLGDVAEDYVNIRTTQQRIELLQGNVKLQRGVLRYIEDRLEQGFHQTKLDQAQALSLLRQDEAGIEVLEISKRQFENALCILLGIPAIDIEPMLGTGPIPVSQPDVALGIPADLLRRRPDVRRAERLAAAQAEQIGIAEADLYPSFFINGSLGYSAQFFPDLFRSNAFTGSVGPSFQWNVLNYGRIVNNMRFQDARFQELVVTYQQTVLAAGREVEDGLVFFLRSQRASKLLDESVVAANEAVAVAIAQYRAGSADFNRYATIEQNKVTQQDQAAQSRGNIALGLVQTYRALGGGWEIRLSGPQPPGAPGMGPVTPESGPVAPNGIEQLPVPPPTPQVPPQQPVPLPQVVPPQQPPVPQEPPFSPDASLFRGVGGPGGPVAVNPAAPDTPWLGNALPPNRTL